MAKEPAKHREPWTKQDVKDLKALAKGNTPTPLLAYKIGRTEAAVRNRAADEGISLKPTNKPPYGTKKK